jgi:ubiquinone/menaquinone biosynthesis C-methylase UbiE
MTDQGQFWDSIADKYAKQPVADQAAYEKKLAVTRGYMRPDMEVLEIGCGTGTTALHHAPAVKHIRAVDIAPRMIAIARDKARAAGVANVDFEVSTIDDLQVPDGSLDMVMSGRRSRRPTFRRRGRSSGFPFRRCVRRPQAGSCRAMP